MGFQKKPEKPEEVKVKSEAPTTDAEKFKRLAAVSKALDKKHSTTNSVIRLGSKAIVTAPCISTGLPTIDEEMLQIGGIPRGRIIEIFGPESAGKTTTTLHIIGEEQRQGGLVAFVDAEHALDPVYAQSLGVDVGNMLLNQPNSGEEALQVVEELVKSQCVSLIVVDSVAALVPEAELAGDMGDAHVGLQARLMSQACRKLTPLLAQTPLTTVIFINQIREKIGVMYGNPETTPGGRALKFYSSVRIHVTRKESIWEGTKENIIGHQIRLKAVKNKCGIPFREGLLDLHYPGDGRKAGFDKLANLIEYASNRGIFEMSGSWYSLNGERLANGLANLKEALKGNEPVLKQVRDKIQELRKADAKAALETENDPAAAI